MLPLIIVPLGLFALIVYFAVSKKSSLFIRWAAIMALIIIGISVMVCLFIIFGEPAAVVVDGPVIQVIPKEEVIPVKKGDPLPLLIFGVILLLFIAFIIYTALREQYQKRNKKSSQDSNQAESKPQQKVNDT